MKPPQAPASRSRLWRWGRRVLVASVAAVALVTIAVIALAHNLDRPWVKARLRAEIMTAAGVDVDWRAVDLALLSGIALDDVVVHTKAGFELATAGRVTAVWTTALYTRQKVEKVALADVAVHLAIDEKGATSIDELTKSDRPEPARPLSQKVESALASLKALPTIDVSGLSLDLVRTDHGTPESA